MTIVDTSTLRDLFKKNKTAEAEKEIARLLTKHGGKGQRGKVSLVSLAAAWTSVHHELSAAYIKELQALTKLAKEARELEDTIDQRLKVTALKGKIKKM